MTRKEAIKELEILKEEYWDDDGYGHETKQYDDTMLALDMAIQALEQESILDKIRAEIEAKCCITVGRENDPAITLHDVFEIIDKCKAESEDKE